MPLNVPVPEETSTVLVPARLMLLEAAMPLARARVVVLDIARAPVPRPLLEARLMVPAESVVPPLYVLVALKVAAPAPVLVTPPSVKEVWVSIV